MSKGNGPVVGAIEVLSPEQQQVRAKRDAYRQKSLPSDDAVFDLERGLFMVHGKHPTLAGVEAIVSLDMPSLLSMVHGIIPTVLIPVMVAFAKQNPPKAN